MSAWALAAFLLCVGVATCVQSITGFALVLVLLGLVGLFDLAPLRDAVNVATVLAVTNAFVALRGSKNQVDWPMLRQTSVGTVVGVTAGVVLMAWLSANAVLVLRLLLGVVVVACAVLVLRRAEPLPQRSSRVSFLATGVVSGVLGGLFSASGPPLVYQLYRQPLTLDAVRDTLVALLAVGSILRLVLVIPGGQFSVLSVKLSVIAVPVVMGITWWMKRHPPAWKRETVLKLVCGLLVVTGVGLIAPAIQGLM